MRKWMCAMLALAMLLSLTTSACAVTISNFSLKCDQGIADDQLYQHRYDWFGYKERDTHRILVRYKVDETSVTETNRIAAYRKSTGKTMGVNWIPANYQEYYCTSNAIVVNNEYTVAGRGNTNYTTKYGLNQVTMTGYFLPE